MSGIENRLSPQDREKVRQFLLRIRPLLATNDVTISRTEKNKTFERQFNMRDAQKIEIIKALTENDCIKIERNNHPGYPDAEIFFFIKNIRIVVYGEPKSPDVYIKMYVQELSNYDVVLVISFHEAGMHD